MQNRCAYLDKNHRFTIKTESVPAPADDEVLIRVAANGICGSDIHFYAEGRLGNFVVDEPYIPGHEASGTVAAWGKDVKGFEPGDKVVIEPGIPCGRCRFCHSGKYNLCPSVVFLSAPPIHGTFCDYVSVRADFVHRIPDPMPLEQAALAEPAAVAVHAVNRAMAAGPVTGRSAVIFGMGAIGLMVLQAFRAMGGGHVTCVDRLDNRLRLAERMGADRVINAASQTVPDNNADIVFETAGSPITTALSISAAAAGGTVVQVGWPSGNMVTMNIADLIEKELVYTSVNRYANAFPAAIRYICDGRIDVGPMITHRFAFDDIAEAFRFAKDNPGETVKVVVLNAG